MKLRSLICALGCAVALVPAHAADLLESYRAALQHDAEFARARADREAGRERSVQGRAGLLPNATLSGQSTWNEGEVRSSGTTTSYDRNTNGYTVSLTQPLFRWQNWVQYQQGTLSSALSEVQFEDARQALILRVAEAYFNVLTARDSLAAVEDLRRAAQEQLARARLSFEVGTVTITDVHEAQARADLAEAQIIAAQNALDVARETLFRITGVEPSRLDALADDVALTPPEPAQPEHWITAAESSSYAVQIAGLSQQIAEQEVARREAGHYPTLDLVATHGDSDGVSSETQATTVGVQLNLPLFSGGLTSSQVREAAALKSAADAQADNARRSARLAARQAYLAVTSGLSRVEALQAARVSSQSALEANQLGYDVGVRINIDVLNAQSQLADTQQQLSGARYDTLLAQLRLKAAAAQLGEADVEAVNRLLTD